MAEAVFTHLIETWSQETQTDHPVVKIDSAGTGAYHIGSPPDPRTMDTLQDHGITKFRHAARQVKRQDFERFDYIIGMDGMNVQDLKRKARQVKVIDDVGDQISLFGSWDAASGGDEIDDPYYGGDEGFEMAFEQCVRFSRGWMKSVLGVDAVIDAKGSVTVRKIEGSDVGRL